MASAALKQIANSPHRTLLGLALAIRCRRADIDIDLICRERFKKPADALTEAEKAEFKAVIIRLLTGDTR